MKLKSLLSFSTSICQNTSYCCHTKTTPKTTTILLWLCSPLVRRLQRAQKGSLPLLHGAWVSSEKPQTASTNKHHLRILCPDSRAFRLLAKNSAGQDSRVQHPWTSSQDMRCWDREWLSPENLKKGMILYFVALEVRSCLFHYGHSPLTSGRQNPLTPMDGRSASYF